jgi:hypothetical protein
MAINKACFVQEFNDQMKKKMIVVFQKKVGLSADSSQCLYEQIKKKYTYEEYMALDSDAAKGKTSPVYLEFMNSTQKKCTDNPQFVEVENDKSMANPQDIGGAVVAKNENIKNDVTSSNINSKEIQADLATSKTNNESIAKANNETQNGPSLNDVTPTEAKKPSYPNSNLSEINASEKKDNAVARSISSLDVKEKNSDKESAKQDTKLEDKIALDDTHVDPPSYDLIGRGLVYNCKNKHWACVNKLTYVSCNKNMKWNKLNGYPAECAIINVYSSIDDCAILQNHNTSTGQHTPFCQ